MNNVFISGNLTKEPETFSPEGSDFSCIKFSIANNDESKKKDDGSYENIASFFDLEYWTKKPQYWLQKLQKGIPIAVEGRLKQQTWTDKESGSGRSKVLIIVNKFPLILDRVKKEQAASEPETEKTAPWEKEKSEEDDLPF